MADVITRFKLETTQYDSKLRDAAKGLKEFTHQAQLGGKGFTDFSQKAVESARALGTVASGAMNTKEKVRDLVGAYNEAARAYNSLSEAQQQHDFGKNLAASLETLKGRITEAKQELYGMNEAVEEAGKKTGSLFGEGGLTGMMQVFGGNLLAEGVSKLTSELAGSVQESIELARQGEGIRMAFERLNNPGLLDELKAATHGTVSEIELMQQAIKFENFRLPVEDLANYLAFAQQKAKDTGESIDYLVNSIVTGLGRQSKQILDNLGISAAELTKRMNEGATMTQAVSDIIREEMAKAGDYVETAADRAARAAADTKNKMEDLGRSAMPVAEEFASAWNEIRNGAMTIVLPVLKKLADSIRDIREILNGEWSFDAKISKMPDIGSNIDDNGNFIRKPSNGNWAGFNAKTGQYNNAITAIQDIVVTGNAQKKRTGRSGGRSGRVSSANLPSIDDFNKQLGKSMLDTDALKADNLPSDAWNTMREAIAGCKEEMADYSAETENWTKNFDPYRENMEKMTKAAKQQQMAFNMGAEAANNLGAAFASMEDPAAKAAGTVISAIANIALGFAQASVTASSMGPWGWVAFLAAGAAAMATTISTVHSLTGYANGGIVGGNSYSGDNVFAGNAMVNSGELILNHAQQNAVASELQSGPRAIQVTGRLRGSDIVLSIDRELQQSGRGQLLTWG
jgi:hypothetical protein